MAEPEVRSERRPDDFAAWVRPTLPAMAALAARLAGPAASDDVVQEALVRAWRRWSTYDASRGTPRAWLLAITADRARRTRARRRPDQPVVELATIAAHPPPTDHDIDLERAVAQLPQRQRLAISLVYFVDLPLAEAAAVMGCTLGTVKSTLAKARLRLRELLEGRS